jgi:Tfp pilus assembly protein PilV
MGNPPAQGALRKLRSEAGVTLVETLVAAAILVTILLAVMATLDTASSTTAANRGRTVAAGLAEQDQERMRSMSAADLSNYHTTSTEQIGKVTYTIDSRSDWIRDSTGGAETCTANSKQADFMRITSTVRSNVVGRKIKPVQIRSIVAPRVGSFGANQGTLAVSIKDGAAAPQVGLPVSVVGPESLSDVTNAQGCAVFGHVPVGTYAVNVQVPGYVDPSGANAINVNKAVTPQTVQTQVIQYAQGAFITANFTTKVGNAPEQPTKGTATVASNAALPSPGVRIFSAPAGGATSITTGALFPFSDGYSLYSGTSGCAENRPTQYPGEDDYFAQFGFAKPGAGQTAVVNVREPALNFQVLRGSGSTFNPYGSANVVITSPSCNTKYSSNPLNSNGTLQDPGFPFGTYTICADDGSRRVTVTGVQNFKSEGLALNADGTPTLKLQINTSSSTSGRCT